MSVPANFFDTYDVVASPADDTETVIALLSGVGELLPNLNVHLHAMILLAPNADATLVSYTIRRDGLTGATVGQPWDTPIPASPPDAGFPGIIAVVDTPGDFAGAIYVLTATVSGASGVSTVDSVWLGARTC